MHSSYSVFVDSLQQPGQSLAYVRDRSIDEVLSDLAFDTFAHLLREVLSYCAEKLRWGYEVEPLAAPASGLGTAPDQLSRRRRSLTRVVVVRE